MPTIDEEILRLNQQYKKDNNLLYLPAVIGDSTGRWQDPDFPGKILIREQTSNGPSAARSAWPPAGTTVKLQAGTPVLLEYNELGELRIKGPNTQAALAASQNPIQAVVQPTRDTVPQTALETLRVIPTSPASLIVAVKSWNPIIGGTQYQFGGATVDLTSFVPSAGNMRYVVIFVKSDYATTEVFGSTARSTADVPLDSADIQECLTAATAGSTPVWAIKLTGGQTTITQEDINAGVDERQLVNTANSAIALPLSMTNGGTGSNLSTSDGFLRAVSGTTIPYKWKLNGTAAPGATDDANAGWLVGSVWFDTTNNKVYSCTANTVGAAVWPELTGGGGGAPTTATYITQTPDAGLSAEQALASLATGYMKVTTTTGVVTSQVVPIPEADGGTNRTTGAATKALDNLASVAINTSLIDDTDITDDLGSAAIRWKNGYIQFVMSDVQGQIVKNASGATANAGDVGYLDDNNEYTRTSTASDMKKWCVVLVGGASNADIYVSQRGRGVNVNYTGTAPSTGDYLVTSATPGLAQRQTTMHQAIFAKCRAAGSGGVVAVDLLCHTEPFDVVSPNLLWGVYNHSNSRFISTINGAPTATSVVYGTVTTGSNNVIVPANAGDLGKMILWNTTRNTGRLITAVNNGTQTITTVSTTDSWANTDAITIESQTVVGAGSARFVDVDISSLSGQTTIPVLARSLKISMQKLDSGGGNITMIAHPWETIASSKNKTLWYQTTNFWTNNFRPLPLINQRFAIAYGASGSGTALDEIYLEGYDLAAP